MAKRRKDRRKKRGYLKSGCLFHEELKEGCTCTEDNKVIHEWQLAKKVADAIAWREHCYSINPHMFKLVKKQADKIRKTFNGSEHI